MDDQLITYATWKKYIVLSCHMEKMGIKERRKIFTLLRSDLCDQDSFLPTFGVTAAEFAMWQVLCKTRHSERKKKEVTTGIGGGMPVVVSDV